MIEQDPNGLSPHEPGAKLDAGKPRADLLQDFGLALLAVSEVAGYGATLYSEGGWLEVKEGVKRYRAATMRHWLKSKYEQADGKSGLPHLYHCAWNILAELELQLRSEMEKSQPPEPPQEVSSSLQPQVTPLAPTKEERTAC